jgi:predicted metal-dependent hydrolase
MSTLNDKAGFKARVLAWAKKLDVPVRALSLRQMRNKWASCSTAGNYNFNLDLLEVERDLADYVIVHELLHSHVPNHGKLWKSMMLVHLGDYDALAARLVKTTTSEKTVPQQRLPVIPFEQRKIGRNNVVETGQGVVTSRRK